MDGCIGRSMSPEPCALQVNTEETKRCALALFVLTASLAAAQTATIEVAPTREELRKPAHVRIVCRNDR